MASGQRPSIEFDHHTPEFGQDAARKFAELRWRCPVAHTDSYEGFWVASSYAAARAVISDDASYTVEKSADGTKGGKLIPTSRHAPSVIPGILDGAAHDRLRRPLRAAFAKGNVERVAGPVARRVADALLDDLVGRERFDFAAEFSFRLTVGTIFDFVGLDGIEDREGFIHLLEDAFAIDPEAGGDRDSLAVSVSPRYDAAAAHVRDIVRQRAAAPRGDLISQMTDPGTGLTEDEVVDLTLSILLGGVRTTAASLDNIVVYLDGHPDLRAELAADPSSVPNAVDELTRLASVTPLVARTALRDTELEGVPIRAGERVAALIASANRDDERFPDAETVKLDRRDGLHLAFGAGIHYCLGIWLAKMELRVAVQAVLERMPRFRVLTGEVRRYRLVGVNNGFSALPVSPGA